MPLTNRDIQELAHSVFGPHVRVEVRDDAESATRMISITVEQQSYAIRLWPIANDRELEREQQRQDLYRSMITLRSELRPPEEPPPYQQWAEWARTVLDAGGTVADVIARCPRRWRGFHFNADGLAAQHFGLPAAVTAPAPPPFVSAPKPIMFAKKPAPTVWQRLLRDEL